MPIVDLSPDNFDEMAHGEMPMLIKVTPVVLPHPYTTPPLISELMH